jgi:fatty acid desaturase
MIEPFSPQTPMEIGDDILKDSQKIPHLPSNVLQEFSKIDVFAAGLAIAAEWIAIFITIYLCDRFWHPALYIITIMFIGGRQHALAVLQHDATHYRLLPHKVWNDIVGEIFLAWPILLSNQGFRQYHFLHHRYIGMEQDGNRIQYGTHTLTGEITPSWTFPKNKVQLALWVLIRLCGIAGIIFFWRSIHRILTQGSWRYRLLNLVYYASIVGLVIGLHMGQLLLIYWLIPLGTWFTFTNLLRIAGEHSAIENPHSFYQLTRTTLPSCFDRIFVVPRNISYHIEHHLFPHIPFYRLPELHAQLMKQEDFCQQAHLTSTYQKTLTELVI